MIEVDDVRALSAFAGVPEPLLARVARQAADVRANAGEYLVHEGERARFYVLLEGSLEVTKWFGDTERILATRDRPGDYFGELPLLMGAATFANLRARESVRALCLDATDFAWLVSEDPTFAARVMRSMTERAEGAREVAAEQPRVRATVVGRPYDAACHDLRDFLARNQIAFDYLESDDPCAPRAIEHYDRVREHSPLVQLAGGPLLIEPSLRDLARALGLQTAPTEGAYDVAIVGGGPAGLAAAVYGASEGLRTVLFEREAPGGQAGTSSRIENYLGFPTGISGDELASRAHAQASRFGAELVVTRTVVGVDPAPGCQRLTLDGGDVVEARAVVLATGVAWRTLDIPGFDRFGGAGVYYGAARTEALATRGQDVFLVGAGNSAGQAAMFFANYARSVTLVVRGAALEATMSDYLIRELGAKQNVGTLLRSEIVVGHGDGHLEAIDIADRAAGTTARHATSAVFAFIGADAETGWLPPAIARDQRGYVLTGMRMREALGERLQWPLGRDPYFLETSAPGIFAAGDVRAFSIKRCAAGVGEGSMAIAFIHQALEAAAAR